MTHENVSCMGRQQHLNKEKKKQRKSKIPTLRADRMRQGTGGGVIPEL